MSDRLAFAAIDATWEVTASPWWLERLATVFAATALEPRPSAPTMHVTIEGDGPCALEVDGRGLLHEVRPAAVLDRVVWEVNQLAWRANPGAVLVHGGAVVHDGRAVVVTGPSGAGKSTLVATLWAAGFGYLSDEIAVVTAAGVRPYAKPLSVRPGAQAHLGALAPPDDLAELMTSAWYVPVAAASPAPVAAIVFVDHDGERSTAWHAVPRAEALVRLCDQTPNLLVAGEAGFRVLADVVRAARPVELVANDLDLAVRLVVDRLEADT